MRDAALHAAAMANSVDIAVSSTRCPSRMKAVALFSTSAMIRFIASTARRGYWPAAVSAESMTASVPSRIAFATSLASARVGRGCVIIDSSICVAVITGRPIRLHNEMIRFWASGTSSNGNSTPRSPRATMTPSDARMMLSMFSSAESFSILATTRISFGIIARSSAMSCARRTKLSAR